MTARLLAAAAAAALLAAPAYASNTDTASASVTGYVAAPIVLTVVNGWTFPDVVADVAGGAAATVTVADDDTVTYSAEAAPNSVTNPGDNSGTSTVAQAAAAAADISITCEAGYQFAVSTATNTALRDSITVTPTAGDLGNETCGAGTFTGAIGATLSVPAGTAAGAVSETNAVDITVAYN